MDTIGKFPMTGKGIPRDAFSDKERLREERRRGTVVLVGIVAPIRVELDLVAVVVEDRRVVEAIVGIRMTAFARPGTRARK